MEKYNYRIELRDILKLYSEGYSCDKIGKMLGASRQAIWERIQTAGYETRKKKKLHFIMYDGIKWTRDQDGYFRATSREKNIFLHRYKYEKEVGKIPEGYEIHHIDEDKENNDLTNFKLMTKSEHTKHHQSIKKNSLTL